ncbi:metal ABC transporter solute-binding protein, Zn/Mn family [Pseudomonas typographi]|uniref:metal ABC transporter solute-binding protein, Zn/Mn family n=1 Tax=Pseudomonas typographi TaxID=2715964 RepID=UPI001683C748|nr:zinc ABC transporter substrate-binding protein [Pseudomonas typographi]MBD1587015.1 zinc ABC transporter solute-binding protein [Pseudomonas typographi]
MRCALLLLALVLPLAAQGEPVKVLTSFSILADMVQQIGGEDIELTNVVGPDSDAHTYETTPADGRHVQQADLIVENGLQFEPWLDRLIASSETHARQVKASEGVLPRTLKEGGQTVPDPHAWNSLANARIYAANILHGLQQVDPVDAAAYQRNHDAYVANIDALLALAQHTFESLPPGNKRIVTSHDAFGYLGQAYGIQFIAPQGISTEREPSAADVANLVRQIREQHIKAVFLENIADPRLLQQVASESGARMGGTLYSDALAASGPASTYLGFSRSNIETLGRALAH